MLYDFGFAMGPYQVADLAGIDVQYAARKARWAGLGEREKTANFVDQLYELGRYGQKTGAGYYRYAGRNAIPDPWIEDMIAEESRKLGLTRRVIDDDEIHDRYLFSLIDEGARVLDEGIALRPSDIDVVYVNGFGFPAWRGGPMHYADQIGLERILASARHYEQRFGSRWAPSPLLARLAGEGKGLASLQAK